LRAGKVRVALKFKVGGQVREKSSERFRGPVLEMLLLHKHLNSYTISKDLIVLEPYFF